MNDGSTDGSIEICRRFEQDSRVIILEKANGGLLSARYHGISVASGEYVGFIDADDWIDEDYYENLINSATEHSADICACGLSVEYKDRTRKLLQKISGGEYSEDRIIDEIYPFMLYSGTFYEFGILPSLCTKIMLLSIAKRVILKLDLRVSFGEDATITYRSLLYAKKIVIVDDNFGYHYIQRESSLSRTFDPNFSDRMDFLFNNMDLIRSEHEYDISPQLNYYYLFVIFHYLSLESKYHHKGRLWRVRNAIKRVQTSKQFQRLILYVKKKNLRSYQRMLLSLIKRKFYLGAAFMLLLRDSIRR